MASYDSIRESWDSANSENYKHRKAIDRENLIPEDYLPGSVIESIAPESRPRVLQPFCNDGRELLSLAARGALGTGVDFSEVAISRALDASRQSQLNIEFVLGDVNDEVAWSTLIGPFDHLLLTLGSLSWVVDLDWFFDRCRELLRDNGTIVIWDLHPNAFILGADGSPIDNYPFEPLLRLHDDGVESYWHRIFDGLRSQETVNADFQNGFSVTDCVRSTAQVINSLAHSGFLTERVQEYPYVEFEQWRDDFVAVAPRRFAIGSAFSLPLSFVMRAKKCHA
jgi:SAM-dependent methyltransferase